MLEAMLRQIGAEVMHRIKSFTLKGGAYGNGRTMGHSHGDYDHAAFPFLNLLRNAEPGAGLLALVLWVSTVFPTGSYAYSHGLELEIAGVGGWRRHWIWLIVWHRC